MIKLYDLVFEDIEKNDIDLGDKTQEFNEKLELMSQKDQELLINFVENLNDVKEIVGPEKWINFKLYECDICDSEICSKVFYENKKIRFNKLKKTVTNISSQVLVRKLDEMRKDGLVVKIINKSQNVEYKLSEFGNSVIPIISALKKWSLGRKKEISKIVNI